MLPRTAALCFCLLLRLCAGGAYADECSTALITAAAGAGGRPLLWKNRDTSRLANRVAFVDEKPYSYLGLVDADDASGRRVWTGLNSAGFAIMNAVAYNLPKTDAEAADQEGAIMADALRTCRSVADFEAYLQANQGRALGSQANFGVMDADGGAAVFESHNHGYTRMDAAAAPGKYLIVTNFARSGPQDKGKGYIRFERLQALFRRGKSGTYSLNDILTGFARDLENPLLGAQPGRFIHTVHTINRGSTSAAAVVQGAAKADKDPTRTFWVLLGEPVTGIAVPLWVEAGAVPPEMRGTDAAPINQESLRIKALLRPYLDSERAEYLDAARLKTWLSVLLAKEKDIIARTDAFLASRPTPEQKSVFQRRIAAEVLGTLQGIK